VLLRSSQPIKAPVNILLHKCSHVGFDSRTGEYLVLNPSSADPAVDRITTRVMDAARRHVGTDNDVILCFPKKELAYPDG
jgi:hypothetical protein